MADVRASVRRIALFALVGLAVCAAAPPNEARAQYEGNPPTTDDPIIDVRVVGNDRVSIQRIAPFIRTRKGRNFDPDTIEEDVRKLNKSRMFVSVTTSYQRLPEGIVVLFQVVERPTLRYVKYVGGTLMRSTLNKQTGLKVGDPIDPYLVEEGRRKLEEYYKSKGFAKARVDVSEGNKPGDRGAVFMILEGPKQRVYDVEFEGNAIADDARLKTQISSKPPILYLIKGEVDEQKIDEDVDKLTAYYKGLGFLDAKIGREIEFDETNAWATLRFIINEGPRFRVRNVSVIGVKKFPVADIEQKIELKKDSFFDQATMMRDVTQMQNKYGSQGYVYCNVQPDVRLHETLGELDLVYHIEEGARYRVARVDVRIEGDDPHTRLNTVLNRVDLRPGDIVDLRKIRDSERRLQASGLFVSNPSQGNPPKITWEPPEDMGPITSRPDGGRPPGNFRGQSPDGADEEPTKPLVVTLWGRLAPQEGTVPTVVDAAVAQEPPPIEPRQVRYQSPWQPVGGSSSTAPQATPQYGQVPLGSTAPGSNVQPAAAYTPAANSPGYAAQPGYTAQPVVQAQAVAPGGSYGVPPSYGPPAFASPPPATTQPSYGGPPSYGAPSYGAPSYGAPSYGAQPPSYGVAPSYGAPQAPAPNYGQAAPQPYMGNAPGVGAPPLYGQSAPPNFGGLPGPNDGAPGAAAPGGYGSGNDLTNPTFAPPSYEEPTQDLNLITQVKEAQTGRFMVGIGVNSNAGLLGNIVLDEQNADITRLPTSWRDFIEGRAFRGAGQQVRIEAVPGTLVSRYSFIFRQPYLFDTRIQFGLSGYYFQRYYLNWVEQRTGGRIQFGYQFPLIPDLSVSSALRAESVQLSQPTVPTPASLQSALGQSDLYVGEFSVTHDTRDNTFLATQGHRIMLEFDQGFGTYSFSRVNLEARQHFLLSERPDRSGRQVLTFLTQLGVTGQSTPIYEKYFAGGFSSMRGFNFRGVGPYDLGVNVGGTFQWLNTVEYMFPISADDMIRGVAFCDYGTVENSVGIHGDQFRVSPGLGIRLTVPAMGPAPIALDFAVPILHGPSDNIQNFAFYVGFGR